MSRKKRTMHDQDDAAADFDVSSAAPVVAIQEPTQKAVNASAAPVATRGQQSPQEKPAESLGELLTQLTALDNVPDLHTRPRREQIDHRDKRTALAKRIFAMQQGPTAPNIDANAQAEMRNASRNTEATKQSLIERLKRIAG